MKPLCIDLFCGLGGWAQGFLAEGYDVIGFDIERHDYGTGVYPGQLVLQDVRTLDGRQFRNAAVIVASPPCQEFSYMAMPWTLAKEKARQIRASQIEWARLTELFYACFRIAYEAGVPLIVENVKGAQPWVGQSCAHFGSFYLWGNIGSVGTAIVAARPRFGEILRAKRANKNGGGSWFAVANNTGSGHSQNPVSGRKLPPDISESIRNGKSPARWTNPDEYYFGRKVAGLKWNSHREPGHKAQGFNVTAAQQFRESVNGTKQGGDWFGEGEDSISRRTSSRSNSRKAASAEIAKIPLPLSQWIARAYKP